MTYNVYPELIRLMGSEAYKAGMSEMDCPWVDDPQGETYWESAAAKRQLWKEGFRTAWMQQQLHRNNPI